jgi:hypothetical protein
MRLKTKLKLDGGVAQFEVFPEGRGLYRAELVGYTGSPELSPPARILLIRNVRQWSGSCENSTLLNRLGSEIEKVISSAPIFRENQGRTRHHRRSPEQ